MKVTKAIGKCLLVLLCIVVILAIIVAAQFYHRSDPKNLKQYDTENPFITGKTTISAHRSGAGDFPEETLTAFRGGVENAEMQVDYFEFDLHMTIFWCSLTTPRWIAFRMQQWFSGRKTYWCVTRRWLSSSS